MDAAKLKAEIRSRALALGFDSVGFAPALVDSRQGERLAAFLDSDYHGGMAWLAREPEKRASPQGLWPETSSVIVLGTNYGPAESPLAALDRKSEGTISVYAQGKDYHDLIKKRLKALARWLHATTGAELKVFVDTAPVMEKPLGQNAGLGWQGKHTNLVSRDFGSWLLLGEIYLALDLPPDPPETDHCGGCRRCLSICPTQAFPAPYRLDATRCISYLTIEHHGQIAREFREAIGNRIYGCDDCLAVCPWNKFAQATAEPSFLPRAALSPPRLSLLAGLDDASFRALFSGSPVKRIGRARFVRNVLIAIGNSGDLSLVDTVLDRLDDASGLVRGMAIWALARLAPERLVGRTAPADETDPEVLAEWGAIAGPALSAPSRDTVETPRERIR